MKYIILILITFSFMMTSCKDSGRMADNPLYTSSSLPFEAPDFDAIEAEHFKDAFRDGMAYQLEEIEEITSNSDEPTFENTMIALEKSGELLGRARRVFSNLTSAHTNET
ncbi:MAG: hypothetical protein WDZ38_07675, partial [Balneolaceae bacterium]